MRSGALTFDDLHDSVVSLIESYVNLPEDNIILTRNLIYPGSMLDITPSGRAERISYPFSRR